MDLEPLKKTIEEIGETLDPEEDWMPVLILEKDNKGTIIALCDSMNSQETKDITAKFMTEKIAEMRPDTAIFVSTAWYVTIKKTEDEYSAYRNKVESGQIPMPSKHPDREEIVVVVGMDEISDTTLKGEILRLPNEHPEIVEWKEMNVGDGNGIGGGRFIEAMREGFNRKEKNGDDRTKNR